MLFSLLIACSTAHALEGDLLDADELAINSCSLIQSTGADSRELDVVNICPGFIENGEKHSIFVGLKECTDRVRESAGPKVVYCSGQEGKIYVSRSIRALDERNDLGGFFLSKKVTLGTRGGRKFKEVQKFPNTNAARGAISNVLKLDSSLLECAVFSKFGPNFDDFGSLRGAPITYEKTNGKDHTFSLKGKFLKDEVGSQVMCRNNKLVKPPGKYRAQTQQWIQVGLVMGFKNQEEEMVELRVKTVHPDFLLESTKTKIATEFKRVFLSSFSHGGFIRTKTFQGKMLGGYNDEVSDVLVSSGYNLCSLTVRNPENHRDVIDEIEENEIKIPMKAYFGSFDLRMEAYGQRHFGEEKCKIGAYGRSLNYFPGTEGTYSLDCTRGAREGVFFSTDGSQLVCGDVRVSPGVLNILSRAEHKTCMKITDDCMNRVIKGIGYAWQQKRICAAEYKSCMYNLPVVNNDVLRNASAQERLDIDYAYYVASTAIKENAKLRPKVGQPKKTYQYGTGNTYGGYKPKVQPKPKGPKTFVRDSDYRLHEKSCFAEYIMDRPNSNMDRNIESFEACLLENPRSFTGIMMKRAKEEAAKKAAEKPKN